MSGVYWGLSKVNWKQHMSKTWNRHTHFICTRTNRIPCCIFGKGLYLHEEDTDPYHGYSFNIPFSPPVLLEDICLERGLRISQKYLSKKKFPLVSC
jgi:hypothetical protein